MMFLIIFHVWKLKKEYEGRIGGYFYTFKKINFVDKYKDKLVIDWG